MERYRPDQQEVLGSLQFFPEGKGRQYYCKFLQHLKNKFPRDVGVGETPQLYAGEKQECLHIQRDGAWNS